MTLFKRNPLAIFAIPFVLGLGAHSGLAETTPKAGEETLGRQSFTDTVKCFSSGSKSTLFKVCINTRGHIQSFESPAGAIDWMNREGYAVCSGNPTASQVHGYDAGLIEQGWGAPIVTQPNGAGKLPLIVKRTSLDKKVQLTQTFTTVPDARVVQIAMAVKNISASPLPLALARYFDADFGSETDDDIYDSNRDSVWAMQRDTNLGFINDLGIMLKLLPTPGIQSEGVEERSVDWAPFANGTALRCFLNPAEKVPGPTNPGDFVGRIIATMPALQPGQTKTVTFRYRRF